MIQKPIKWLLIILGSGVTVIMALIALVVLWAIWGADEFMGERPVTQCSTPLAETRWCKGLDSSWTDCHWSFHAEGKPDPLHCRRFLNSRPRGTSPKDYDDVTGFSVTDCSQYGLPANMSCFFGERLEHLDETQRYLLAFDDRCEKGIVLRACNAPLRTYPDTSQDSSATTETIEPTQ